jgi:hypothetical protein
MPDGERTRQVSRHDRELSGGSVLASSGNAPYDRSLGA